LSVPLANWPHSKLFNRALVRLTASSRKYGFVIVGSEIKIDAVIAIEQKEM